MGKARHPVSINGIQFDALISEDRGFEATAPEYSVEDGFPVSDAIILGAETLDMTLYVTNTPVTWAGRLGGPGRVDDVVRALEQLYYSAQPCTVITTDKVYTNMALEGLTLSKTPEDGYSREIPVSFKKIRVTSSRTTTIPDSYGKSGKTEEQAGTVNTEESQVAKGQGASSQSSGSSSSGTSSSGDKSSILYSAANSMGLLG